jgi:hypothetical protein
MAGSPGAPNDNPFRKEKPKVTTFSCKKCGAPVTVRYPGHSLSAVCESCFSVIDTSDENFRVLETYYKKAKIQPRIDLGTRGELKGKTWECIGFVVREDVASTFKWEEYLLFNPYYGYRWLTCNNGHWSFVTMIKERPERFASKAEFEKETYKLFYQGKATVFYVLGEFYWKVQVGEEVGMADFICPPKMVSVEEDKAQRVWSVSEYVEPKTISEAFKLSDESLPRSIGVAPNQPSPATDTWKKVGPLWAMFLFALTCLQIFHCSLAKNLIEFRAPIEYISKTDGSFAESQVKTPEVTTPEFVLDKANANVEINIESEVDNSWLYVYGELVNTDTEESFSFERTLEYYHGYEDGESWSEGSRSTSIFMPQVPGGKYYMNLDIDNGGSTSQERRMFNISVKRDVATFHNYLWCLFLISIYPICAWLRSRAMEVARWSDSDYSPYQSSSD